MASTQVSTVHAQSARSIRALEGAVAHGSQTGLLPTLVSRLFATEKSWPLFVARVALAVAIFPHGAQKLIGAFGGYGFTATIGYFADSLGIPVVFGFLAIVVEFFGPIALLTGVATRIAAAGVAVVMLVATFTVHLGNGFFMNWSGEQAGEGFEYHILALGLAVAIIVGGAGAQAVDRAIARRLSAPR